MTDQLQANDKLFHARVFRLYLGYLKDKLSWTDEQIESFLAEVNTTQGRIDDDSSWFDVKFADHFFDVVAERTGDPKIAFNAGTYIKRDAFSSTIYQLMRGLISVGNLYRLLSKFTPHFTKAAKMRVAGIRGTHAIIESTPIQGFNERAYMCENRTGILSALPIIYGQSPAQVRHLECVQDGASQCRYAVEWQEESNLPFWTGAIISGALVFLIANQLLSLLESGLITVIYSLFFLSLVLYRKYRVQEQEFQLQNKILDQAVESSERKNLELDIAAKVTRLTHEQIDLNSLSTTLVRNVCQLMGYNRSIFLLVNRETSTLGVKAHYGFSEEMQELLNSTEFNIRDDNTSGWFIQVVNTKKPVLIQNVKEGLDQLSARSKKFAKIMQSTSFVAVPLMNERGEVIGVLAVDNTEEHKILTLADQDLLMTLADHLGVAVQNAKLVDSLEKSLDLTKKFSVKQERLREAFQKFVPTQMATQIIEGSASDALLDLFSQIKKRKCAILFMDIFGFSTLTEDMESESVIDLLNIVFLKLAPCIEKHHGFIDKFTGDGFLAVFDQYGDSSHFSARAALEMISKMTEINAELISNGYPEIEIGIGLNLGEVILGNVGSENRVNFTVIGEAVNMAARLEAHTRSLGANSICAAHSIRAAAGDAFDWKPLGRIELKGYSQGAEAFELVSESPASQSLDTDDTHSKPRPS